MPDDLTPAQVERLAFIAEELAEAIQMAGKSLRHGLDSTHHDYNYELNRRLLAKELGHVQAGIDILIENGDIYSGDVKTSRAQKLEKILRGTHFHRLHKVPNASI